MVAELRDVVASLRARLKWIQHGGTDGLPMPTAKRARPPQSVAAGGGARTNLVNQSAAASAAGPIGPRPSSAPVPRSAPPVDVASPDSDDPAVLARAAVENASRLAARTVLPTARPASRRPESPSAVAAAPVFQSGEMNYPELVSIPRGAEGLQKIREFVGDCRRCKLCHGRNQLVFGEGNAAPLLAFVGEGPGADEDRTGLPFVGAAGELLSKMIKAMGEHASKLGLPDLAARLSREQVYIGNVVKCRPPGNRVPEADEIAACGPFVAAQLVALNPRVIVALGRTPTQFLLRNNAPLGRLRGQFGDWNGTAVMPTYHPAYLLRTPSAKAQVWEDLKLVIMRLTEEFGHVQTSASPSLIERNP